jgi:hypothetical protein
MHNAPPPPMPARAAAAAVDAATPACTISAKAGSGK